MIKCGCCGRLTERQKYVQVDLCEPCDNRECDCVYIKNFVTGHECLDMIERGIVNHLDCRLASPLERAIRLAKAMVIKCGCCGRPIEHLRMEFYNATLEEDEVCAKVKIRI